MNLPNQLTILRIILIPVFFVVLMQGYTFTATLIFAGASITDALDGHIARKNNLITNFGKIMDPLADKLLVTAAFMCFIQLNLAPAWMIFIIIARELTITALRAVAASEGIVIAASKWGKFKTISQMIAIIILLMNPYILKVTDWPIGTVFLWVALGFTLISGIDYIVKNKRVFSM